MNTLSALTSRARAAGLGRSLQRLGLLGIGLVAATSVVSAGAVAASAAVPAPPPGSAATTPVLHGGVFTDVYPTKAHYSLFITEDSAGKYDGFSFFTFLDGTSANVINFALTTGANGKLSLTSESGATHAGTFTTTSITLPGCTAFMPVPKGTQITICTFKYLGPIAPYQTHYWTRSVVMIDSQTLGDVLVGMSVAQAERASGEKFNASGDGYLYDTNVPSGYAHLYVRTSLANGSTTTTCIGASAPSPKQTIITPEGFTLGQSVQKFLSIYGKSAKYVPAPKGGISPVAGYIVQNFNGRLVFWLDRAGKTVVGIATGDNSLVPSACTG